MNVGIGFDYCLRSVAVVDVPIDNQHSPCVVSFFRVERGERDVAEETKPHRSCSQSVVSRRARCAKRSSVQVLHCTIDCGECAPSSSGRGSPGAFTCDSVRIESSAAGAANTLDHLDVPRIMSNRKLIRRRVPADNLFDGIEQLRIRSQRSCDRTQSSYMLRMIPSGIMTAAVGVRYEGDVHAADKAAI